MNKNYFIELDSTEEKSISGGGWFSYFVGYLMGSWNTPEGSNVAKALNDFH